MAQFYSQDENSHCLSSSGISNLHSYFGDSHPVNNLISQMQIMRTKEMLFPEFSLESDDAPDSGGLGESSDSLNQLEDCSPPTDLSTALRSVALMRTLDLKKTHFAHVPNLFSVLRLEDNQMLSPSDHQDTDWAAAPAEEEEPTVSFQSKFINFFPLYQDYCLQAVRDDLHRLSKSCVSELIVPQHLLGVQCQSPVDCHSEATSPQLNTSGETSSSPLPHPVRVGPPSRPRPHPVRVTPSTLWQDLEEVKASGLLSRLTTREIRLQETMFELIGSEVSYLKSLRVAVNHFYASKELERTLTQMEHHVLFSNIRCVMAASEKFLGDLEMRLGECVLISQVDDIVLQHCSRFHSLYVPYVTNMMYQETLVDQLLQQNRDFLSSIKKLESDPVCQRRSLKSFLVLPFQRITRIKLILESILKLTEPEANSVSNLEKAIEAIHEILTECDNLVKKMKQIEELVGLEMLLDFSKVKAVPLVVSGRFLVQQGAMRQLTLEASNNPRLSFISIYLHLFNDLLILSSKKALRFTVMDHAALASRVHVECLNTEALGLPTDSFLLHLSKSHTGQPTAIILVAHSRSDKEMWMKALSSKQ